MFVSPCLCLKARVHVMSIPSTEEAGCLLAKVSPGAPASTLRAELSWQYGSHLRLLAGVKARALFLRADEA